MLNFTEITNVLGAAYADLGSNGGFPQPFYAYFALYLSDPADVRIMNFGGGTLLYEQLAVAPQTLVYNQFRIGGNMRLQARGAGVNATVVWYNRR